MSHAAEPHAGETLEPRDRVIVKRALLSVFKKDGIVELAAALAARGVVLLSTGGTAALLRERGHRVVDVAEITGFPEMMDGRVKTLHPKVHGALLMRRDVESHVEAARRHGIEPIDLVIVNLYPFGDVIAEPGVDEARAIEMIDIGGPSMVRSAAKNHAFTAVLTDPAEYTELIGALDATDGATTLADRRRWAKRAFARTSAYDAAIHAWLGRDEALPERLQIDLTKRQDLRYGENPHQRGALYLGKRPAVASVAWSVMHSGKELSYNNYLDADAALACVSGHSRPTAVIIKHKNPCGAAGADDLTQAFLGAWAGDPLSAYGGIVAFNRPVDEDTARAIAVKDRFFEVIVAPGYEGRSLEILQTGAKWGKNVRILELQAPLSVRCAPGEREVRWLRGGYLVQDPDQSEDNEFQVVSKRPPSAAEAADLRFAWEICRHVTSNAIVFAKDGCLVATGAGQMSRVDAVDIAARKGGERCRGAVMASDAFFPFPDGVQVAAAAGITAVIQPGGSMRDDAVRDAADAAGLAMVLTGRRHFRH